MRAAWFVPLGLLVALSTGPVAHHAPPAPPATNAADAIAVRAPSDPPPVPAADLACRVDTDCARVFRRCGTCDCGAALARDRVAAYDAERERRCRDVVGPVCEMDCRRPRPACVAGQCELVPEPAPAGGRGGAGLAL